MNNDSIDRLIHFLGSDKINLIDKGAPPSVVVHLAWRTGRAFHLAGPCSQDSYYPKYFHHVPGDAVQKQSDHLCALVLSCSRTRQDQTLLNILKRRGPSWRLRTTAAHAHPTTSPQFCYFHTLHRMSTTTTSGLCSVCAMRNDSMLA